MITIEVTIIETDEDVEIELECEDSDSNDNGDSFEWQGSVDGLADSWVQVSQLRNESNVEEENIQHGSNIKVNKKRIADLINRHIEKSNIPDED